MKISCFNGMYYVTSELFSSYGIKHLFTTIKDDSKEKNLDFSTRISEKKEVISNYEKVSELLRIPLCNFVKSTQIHEDNIVLITPYHRGMGILRETELSNADGIYTAEDNVPLCIFSADCVPILIADKKKRAVMAVHAGWRGTAKDIAGKAIRILKSEFNADNNDILCATGPAIGQCCFEVSEDVICALSGVSNSSECYYKKENGKYQLDLKAFNKELIKKEGVPEENIDLCSLCTKCEKEYFHSYRRQGDKAGRNAGFIAL